MREARAGLLKGLALAVQRGVQFLAFGEVVVLVVFAVVVGVRIADGLVQGLERVGVGHGSGIQRFERGLLRSRFGHRPMALGHAVGIDGIQAVDDALVARGAGIHVLDPAGVAGECAMGPAIQRVVAADVGLQLV